VAARSHNFAPVIATFQAIPSTRLIPLVARGSGRGAVSEAVDETLESIAVPEEAGFVEGLGDELGAATQVDAEGLANAEAEIETEAGESAAESQGQWVEEDLSASQRALEYQTQITGHPRESFQLNGVNFEGALEKQKP